MLRNSGKPELRCNPSSSQKRYCEERWTHGSSPRVTRSVGVDSTSRSHCRSQALVARSIVKNNRKQWIAEAALLGTTSDRLPDRIRGLRRGSTLRIRFHPAFSSERAQMCRRGAPVPRRSSDRAWLAYRRACRGDPPTAGGCGAGGQHVVSAVAADCRGAAWARASDGRLVAHRGMRWRGRRAADLLLELAQAFVEPFAVERPDVNIDDLYQFGGLGCREIACRDRSRDARCRFDTVGRLLDRRQLDGNRLILDHRHKPIHAHANGPHVAALRELDQLAGDALDACGQQFLRQDGCPIERSARASGRISALALLKAHGCLLLYFPVFLQKRETRRARPQARTRNEKPGAACRPGSWRSFGEYVFLEDSRYTSQAENLARIKSLSSHENSAIARERQI